MSAQLLAIARTVFDALERDFAGMPECDDGQRAAWEEQLGRIALTGKLDDELFWRLMTQRLAALGDGNLSLLPGPGAEVLPCTCGFEAREYRGDLWVTAAALDGRLRPGDRVTHIDGLRPAELLAQAGRACTPGEREREQDDTAAQRRDWANILAWSHALTVARGEGETFELATRAFPQADAEQPSCAFERLDDRTCLLTVAQLDDMEAAALVVEHAAEVRAAPRLAIDVRRCSGGVESMAYPLLNLLFDEAANLRDLVGDERVLTLYTHDNCARREEQIAQLRRLAEAQGDEGRDEALAWMDENLSVVGAMRGKGYVEEVVSAENLMVAAGPAGQRVLVLIDSTTSDAAEWLARLAKQSARATVVGRATRGNLDYSNPVTVTFGDAFVFVYPITKTVDAAEGRGMRGVGVTPEVAVPFTPEECARDVILECALEL